jgi:hypothetical protein
MAVQTNPIWSGIGSRESVASDLAHRGNALRRPSNRSSAPNEPDLRGAIWRIIAARTRSCDKSGAGVASEKRTQFLGHGRSRPWCWDPKRGQSCLGTHSRAGRPCHSRAGCACHERLAASLRTGLLCQTNPISAYVKRRTSAVRIRSCDESDAGTAQEKQSQKAVVGSQWPVDSCTNKPNWGGLTVGSNARVNRQSQRAAVGNR